ncbi:MAG TPA: DUF5915 domain-containing protein, partial [Bacillota bacterium]|nr:DUF5915 domain-containing protein [Bacillota bacterium]
KNVYTFFALYANTDSIDPKDFFVEYKDRPELDRWILSKYNNLIAEVDAALDVYDLTRAARKLHSFVNEDLSNWYIRRSRRRFWDAELTEDKKAVYNTTYEILVGVSKLMAPLAPYLPEEIYRNLTGELSVHVAYFPEVNEDLIDNKLEERMDLVRSLVGLGRASREQVRIKVRQPLQKVFIDAKYEELISYLIPLIQEELNVKEVIFEKNLNKFIDFTLKPDYKFAGPVLGAKMKAFAKVLEEMDAAVAAPKFEAGETVKIELEGEPLEVNKDYVITRIAAKEGFTMTTENNLFIILDTTLTKELIEEGYAREFISKVQQMRKNNAFEMMDRINIYYDGDDEIAEAVKAYEEYIMTETLAEKIERVTDANFEVQDLNGHQTGMKVEKI